MGMDLASRLAAEPVQEQLLKDRVQVQFEEYHAKHPDTFERLAEIVSRYHRMGQRRGIGFFFEILRHEAIMAPDADGFRMNNNFRSRYARMLEARCPWLSGYFRSRTLRARLEA